MVAVGSYEAKTKLPQLLAQVAKGARITITKHGQPVAMLVPIAGVGQKNAADTIGALRRFRRKKRRGGVSVRAMINEGRR